MKEKVLRLDGTTTRVVVEQLGYVTGVVVTDKEKYTVCFMGGIWMEVEEPLVRDADGNVIGCQGFGL